MSSVVFLHDLVANNANIYDYAIFIHCCIIPCAIMCTIWKYVFIKTELWLTADISGFYFVLTCLQNNKVKMKMDLYNELKIQTVISLNIVIGRSHMVTDAIIVELYIREVCRASDFDNI